MSKHEQRKAHLMRDPEFRKAYEEAAADAWAADHPEFEDWKTDSVHRPPPPERFDGKRVLIGYKQTGAVLVVPPDESRTASQRELLETVEVLLDLLPPARADLLRGVYWERQTHAQVGADLGLSQQAVTQRLRTAEKHLRKLWEAYNEGQQ